jgi:hypothetical protein
VTGVQTCALPISITKLTFIVMPLYYLRTSRSWTPCPSGTQKRNAERSDSIRSKGIREGP